MDRKEKTRSLARRHRRVRKKVVGTSGRPRLAVYRSNRHIYAQVIDDSAGRTLVSASTATISDGDGKPTDQAKAVGLDLAGKATAAGITRVTFDRGGFRYHGQIQALADGAREGGLEF